MNILSFIITIILVTTSGALAPDPLFFATISYGAKSGAKSGLVFSVAHMLVEFTLIMLFALVLLTVASEPMAKLVIEFVGEMFLIAFGMVQICNSFTSRSGEPKNEPSSRHLFLVGLVFTGLKIL